MEVLRQEDRQKVLTLLKDNFFGAKSELVYGSDYQLLVSVILSAQCTDKRVNSITPTLFEKAATPSQMLSLGLTKLEEIIKPCGFYHSKAKYIMSASADIVERFNGQVPKTKEQLKTLSGVGEKTANVVYAVAMGGQAIAVDTHVFRVSNRLGLVCAKNVLQTQRQLEEILPQNEWSDFHHYLLLCGRYICKSRRPLCEKCFLTSYCKHYLSKETESR